MKRYLQTIIMFAWLVRACYTPYEVASFIGTLPKESAETAKVLSHSCGNEFKYNNPNFTVIYQL